MAKQPEELTFTDVPAGGYVVMVNERWLKGSEADVNGKLDRTATKIGVALEAFTYEANEGGDPQTVKTFTLRQFWVDRAKPTMDFTPASVREFLNDVEKFQGVTRRRELEGQILPAVKQFAKVYADYEKDLEAMGASAF